MEFRDLKIGQSFDFLNDAMPRYNSFFKRCTKTGFSTYEDEDGDRHRVGTIKANVYHVGTSES